MKERPKYVDMSGSDPSWEVIEKLDDPEVAYILGYLDGSVDRREIPQEVLEKAGKMVKEYLEKRGEVK